MSLVKGYASSIGFKLSGLTIPDEATFTAHVRDSAGTLLDTLTTAGGHISVASDGDGVPTVTLSFTAAMSLAWSVSRVVVDVVRTDVSPANHLGFKASLVFLEPVTQGLG